MIKYWEFSIDDDFKIVTIDDNMECESIKVEYKELEKICDIFINKKNDNLIRINNISFIYINKKNKIIISDDDSEFYYAFYLNELEYFIGLIKYTRKENLKNDG